MKIISRKEAMEQGLKRFFTGKPCKRGHIAERLCRRQDCIECKKITEKRNPNTKIRGRRKYLENRDVILIEMKEKYKITGPRVEYTAEWRAKNKERTRKYRQDNAGLYAYHAANRRKTAKIATPKWIDKEAVRDIYIRAAEISKETGILHHVDHIIPLKNENVCGLHWEENLQIIPATENIRKKNKF